MGPFLKFVGVFLISYNIDLVLSLQTPNGVNYDPDDADLEQDVDTFFSSDFYQSEQEKFDMDNAILHNIINSESGVPNNQAILLRPGEKYECCDGNLHSSHKPVVYCFPGVPKGIFRLWISISVNTSMSPDQYELYEGSDYKEVFTKFNEHSFTWSFNWMNWKEVGTSKEIELNPFSSSCIGINTKSNYTLNLKILDVGWNLLVLFIIGTLLFWCSPMFSNSTIFYFMMVIIIGVCASFVIVLYFILKLLSFKKAALLGAMAGGATMTSIVAEVLYKNLYMILRTYQNYVYGYILSASTLSLILYYRFGPISDRRSKAIVKYILQLIATGILFHSSYYTEAIAAYALVLLLQTNTGIVQRLLCRSISKASSKKPAAKISGSAIRVVLKQEKVNGSGLRGHVKPGRWIWSKCMPSRPPKRFLSMKEYEDQGRIETEKALNQLRDYCQSPEFFKKRYEKKIHNIAGLYHFIVEDFNGLPRVEELPEILYTSDSDTDTD